MGDDKRRPYPEQPGDEARVGATLAVAHPATLAVAHPESGTASFPSYEVACHALVASVPTRTRPSGNRAWATTSVAPTPEQPGDEARVGATLAVAHPATLAVAHPESSTLRFLRTRWRATPLRLPYRPERGHRETGMGDGAPCGRDSVGDDKRGRRQGWATTSVGDDKRRPYGLGNLAQL